MTCIFCGGWVRPDGICQMCSRWQNPEYYEMVRRVQAAVRDAPDPRVKNAYTEQWRNSGESPKIGPIDAETD